MTKASRCWARGAFAAIAIGLGPTKDLLDNAPRGSEAFKARARAKAEPALAASKGRQANNDARRRETHAAAVLYQLEYETGICERLAELRAIADRAINPHGTRPIPARCTLG